jgi:prepilin-type processing-associated H-X9-DG protein
MTNRRSFLSRSLGVAVLGGTLPTALMRAASARPLPALGSTVDPANVLVVIQMGGGNDGLNTIVPWSDDAYHRARPVIRVAENSVIKLNDRIGLNPALAGLNALYADGHVAIIQGVGYPNPNRSHFEATQIWETASPEHPLATGWLGRTLDRQFPLGTKPPSFFDAVALGDTLPTALVAQHVDVAAIGTLNSFAYNTVKDVKTQAGVLYDGAKPGQSPYLGMIAETARQAYHGGDVLRAKIAGYAPAATYPTDGFSNELKLAAQLIGSDVGVRIIFVSLGSFDTHANQRAQQDRLLKYMADGLLAFYRDLAAHGRDKQVLTMTFSEFGRRVTQNASNGTDHGTAMPLFVVGGGVKGGIYGDHPSLVDLDNGDLRYHTDFRSVYATVLERWLGRTSSDVLAGSFAPLPIV